MAPSLIEQLAASPTVGQEYRPFALSPAGDAVAFEWYQDGDWQIFLKALPDGEPRRVGELNDRCGSPQFSPDGRHLYFTCDDRGSECYDVYRYEISTGQLDNLLPDTPELAPLPDPDLSPDGSRLALTVAHGAGYAVAVMPARPDPGVAGIRHLTQHPYTESSPRWSPDGAYLAVTSGTHGQDTAIVVLDAESGETRVVGGSEEFFAGQLSWSPDGHRIAFAGGPGDRPAIGIYELATGSVSWAWEDHHVDAHHPVWAPDGAALAFLVDVEGETGLLHIDLRDGEVTEYSIGPGNHYAPCFTPDGSALVCVLSSPDAPPDLFSIGLADGDVTALTDSLPDKLRTVPFVSGSPVRFTSWDHLAEVPGILVEPDEPNGAAVVIVHGGPTWHHANEWDVLRQAFVAAGVTVLHPNYRGSDGYGRRWQLANRWLMGQGEVLDVAAAHEFLVGLGCDPARIAITGRSWGGFHTMAAVTQFPDLWAAGVAGVPFFDFIDSATDPDIREDLRWWDHENTGDVEKDRSRLEYYSPINHLDAVEAPLLLLGGALDPRCPPKQIAEVTERLRARGRICDYVVYPDEGHEISGLKHRIDYDRRTVDFILEHVGVPG
ncbi:MAG TPA: prolyl oligopeptidase family serine peptidase [Thermoleophilia bacterium]|nr:prolyl oligopeptidase family serine peptidase [Thermoleophilia bacterium]